MAGRENPVGLIKTLPAPPARQQIVGFQKLATDETSLEHRIRLEGAPISVNRLGGDGQFVA